MARPRSRGHRVTVTVPTGTTNSENFNLSAGSRLIHVSLSVFDTGGTPLRVNASLIQPRAGPVLVLSRIVGGWVRSSSENPANTQDVSWDGDLEIDTDMALRCVGRNDGSQDKSFVVDFVVIE